MKTKRVVVGGSTAFAGSLAQQSAPLMLAVALLGTAALACKSGSSGQENGTPADPGPAVATPQGADVVRYSGMEVVETGQSGVRQSVQARRAADWSSPTVATLYAGTQISRVARYGNFSLVSWTGPAGAQQGWVDTNTAFSVQQRIDAGTGLQPPTFGAATATTPPTTTTPPTATTPPTTTTPPTATTPPKPTATTTTTTTAPRTGFRPPKLK